MNVEHGRDRNGSWRLIKYKGWKEHSRGYFIRKISYFIEEEEMWRIKKIINFRKL